MSSASTPDIDRILDAIRAEAKARGSKGRAGAYAPVAAETVVSMETWGILMPEIEHVGDLLGLPLDVFLETAYLHLLGRPADSAATAHYGRALVRGRLRRAEVLGRLAFSPEGRARARRVPGLVPAFAAAMLYRVPLAGPLAALAARALCLPAHLLDRSAIEASGIQSGTWLKR